ncbi:class I glutamine amidotransferase [Aspergillus japonicus CBS 114.51]|uniref:Class I glutamine amidotransferase n=1 Tax=Aspergillus japonicus CBS 114.51 TaxID=1448312 RepID=A0A8T8WVV1_ASPJA|nr:class I glutamine amidotransferase [Aspergillus japonicus CBS 114.51]RAH79966.1 class I glutamine amidotransferase [Aspergillus japonicus CBS 114.51]
MHPPLRIAILECDTPVDKVNTKYGGYRGVFAKLLHESAAALGQPDRLGPETGLDITGWDVVTAQEYPNLDDVDALVLSGSSEFLLHCLPCLPCFSPGLFVLAYCAPCPAFISYTGQTCTMHLTTTTPPGLCKNPDDSHSNPGIYPSTEHDSFADHPWILKLVDFTRKAYEDKRIKIFAICFGHQILARALGVKVGRNPQGWELAVCEVDLSEQGRELFGKEKLRIHQMHQDIAYGYPSEVISLGASPRCAVQGMYVPRKLITVQGHPEFREDIMDELITLRTASGLFSPEMSQDASSRAGLPHDGVAITVAFLKLVLESR